MFINKVFVWYRKFGAVVFIGFFFLSIGGGWVFDVGGIGKGSNLFCVRVFFYLKSTLFVAFSSAFIISSDNWLNISSIWLLMESLLLWKSCLTSSDSSWYLLKSLQECLGRLTSDPAMDVNPSPNSPITPSRRYSSDIRFCLGVSKRCSYGTNHWELLFISQVQTATLRIVPL